MKKKVSTIYFKNYIFIAIASLASYFISKGALYVIENPLVHSEAASQLPIFIEVIIIFFLGFVAYELAKPTIIPSFVLAIFFGFIAQDSLQFITQNQHALSILTTIGATLILFGGGLDTPFVRFKALLKPILSLAFLGTALTAFVFSFLLMLLNKHIGPAMPLGAIIVLGAAIASTDPAAIIPSFKSLYFTQPRVKHIAVSESALNDVIGALLTSILLALVLSGKELGTFTSAYQSIFNQETLLEILRTVGVGIVSGVVCYYILKIWSKSKEKVDTPGEADGALFLALPLLAYVLANTFGGNGFLAVFVTGLLFQLKSHVEHVEHFFNHTVEGFMKPLIFMLLGTMVSLPDLLKVASIGLVMSILFILVIRPFVVFVSLSPCLFGKDKMSVKELLFLSFVRETGVIPAVLLVGLKVANLPGSNLVIAVGMWVILATLITQPPLTPWYAKKLRIAKDLPPIPTRSSAGPTAVLCSRGYSFLERINTVVSWANKHSLKNITLLHCAEAKYNERYVSEVEQVALSRFKSINESRIADNLPELNFSFLSRPGSLHDNIDALVKQDEVSIIFVGSKMLDYRINDVKSLHVPFIFLN